MVFHENINYCIDHSNLPSELKSADVTPAYKKKSKNSKDNYRPISILSNIFKIYERFLYDQIQNFFENSLIINEAFVRVTMLSIA